MTEWQTVCRLEDLIEERGAACMVDGRQVAIFRVEGGTVVAVSNRDPFAGANVISRGIVGTRQDRWFVASPMYKNRFDLATGRSHDDADVALETFRTRVEHGTVYVATTEA